MNTKITWLLKSIPLLLDLSLTEMTQRAASMRLILKHKPTIRRTEINTTGVQRMGDKAAQEGTLLDNFVYPGGWGVGNTPRGAFRKASPPSLPSCCVKEGHTAASTVPPSRTFSQTGSVFSLNEPALLGAAHLGGASCLKVQIQ